MTGGRLSPTILSILVAGAFATGAYVFYCGLVEVRGIRRIEQSGRTVTGTVMDKMIDWDPDGPDHCYITVAYEHGRRPITARRLVSLDFCNSKEVGQAIAVRYSPEDPAYARLAEGELVDLDRNVSYLFIGILFFVVGAYGVYHVRRRRDRGES